MKWRSASASTSPPSISFSRAYWRIVSSIRNRVARTSVDDHEAARSTRRVRPSRSFDLVDRGRVVTHDLAPGGFGRPAASEDRESRSNRRSSSVSRSQLQSMSARKVCCRGTRRAAAAGEEPEPVAKPTCDLQGT